MAEADHIVYGIVIILGFALSEILQALRRRRLGKLKPKKPFKPLKITSKKEQIGFIIGALGGGAVTLGANLDLVFGLFDKLLPGQLAFFVQAPFLYFYYMIILVFGIMVKLLNVLNRGHFEDKRKGVSDGMLWAVIVIELILFFIYPEEFVTITNCCDWS